MCAVLLACISLLPALQDKPGANVTEAVKKGVDYLRSQEKLCLEPVSVMGRHMAARELVLWTLINTGTPPTDPFYKKLFEEMTKDKLEATYCVALQTMSLEFIDRVRFQKRIAQCAKFLADNQNSAGGWSYGSPSIYVEDIDYEVKGKPLPKSQPGSLPEVPQNPKVVSKINIKKDRDGEGGDNSNTYVAALGVRAASDAGIVFEQKFLEAGLRCWKDARIVKDNSSGWNYDRANKDTYPAAAASAVSGMLIYGNLLGQNLRKDPVVLAGAATLSRDWSGGNLTPMAGGAETWLFRAYGLYAVEVAELFLGSKENPLARDWYSEGAKLLLEQQKPDGSWDSGANMVRLPRDVGNATYISHPIWDTCFSILFLTKGIKPLQDPAPVKKK